MNSFDNNRRFVVWVMIVPLVATLVIMIGLSGTRDAPQTATAGQTDAAAVSAQAAGQGETIFKQQCTSCHTIGGGKGIGPDLEGVTQQRDQDWLVRWIMEPDKMIAQGDPIATQLLQQYQTQMPDLGLSEAEAQAVLAYIAAQSGAESTGAEETTTRAPQPPSTLAQIPAGDPVIGKDYFTGAKRFQKGGSSCIACHSVTGIGALGGGALGPDLTNAFSKFGEAGLVSFVQNPQTQTMNAVWAQKPLTPQEIGHLVAFMRSADIQRPSNAIGQLALLAGLGGLIFLGIIQVTWRKRLTEVRKRLVG